ncbi:MAG: metalloregulator ArsR/SmtB family transcription factor [Candidatus Pacebacteria bacterium]|nr:metalloregulator ArsR/SmtB family transcription factor [Candidatus Paceibacterota bacterium]
MYSQIFKLHADTLKALANPKRLEIVNLLREQTLNVQQMEEMLDLPQSNLSQHLSVLRKYKIVTTKKEGKEVFYQISHPNFIKASDLIREVLIEEAKDIKLAKELSKDIEKFLPLAHDPVCQMRVSPKLASYATTYQNNNYFFCASGCLEKFTKGPDKYIK